MEKEVKESEKEKESDALLSKRVNPTKPSTAFEPRYDKEENGRAARACWECGETSHIRSNCRKYKRKLKRQRGDKDDNRSRKRRRWDREEDEGAGTTTTEGGRSVIATAVTVEVAVTRAITIVIERAGSITMATAMVTENGATKRILGERNTEDIGDIAILLLPQREWTSPLSGLLTQGQTDRQPGPPCKFCSGWTRTLDGVWNWWSKTRSYRTRRCVCESHDQWNYPWW